MGCRCSSDPELVWLWHRPVATAAIRPLAWEPSCGMGAALEKAKRQKKKKKKKKFKYVEKMEPSYIAGGTVTWGHLGSQSGNSSKD